MIFFSWPRASASTCSFHRSVVHSGLPALVSGRVCAVARPAEVEFSGLRGFFAFGASLSVVLVLVVAMAHLALDFRWS
jgi:hypothetical protein